MNAPTPKIAESSFIPWHKLILFAAIALLTGWGATSRAANADFSANGLIGSYYVDNAFTNLAATRLDPAIDFDWGGKPPFAGMPADEFGVRWQGTVQAPVDGHIIFGITATGGDDVRLLLALPDVSQPAGRLWKEVVAGRSAGQELAGAVDLVRGETYAILLEVRHHHGPSGVHLNWTRSGAAKALVPANVMFPREPLSVCYMSRAWLPVNIGGDQPMATVLTTVGPRLRLAIGQGDLKGAADHAAFAAREMQGNGYVTARLTQVTGTGENPQVGLLLREAETTDTRTVGLLLTDNKVVMQSRTTAGQKTQVVAEQPVQLPVWLKLVRNGPAVCGYTSQTGADDSWILIGRTDLRHLADRVAIGLAGATGQGEAVAAFDNVQALADIPMGGNLPGTATWAISRHYKDLLRDCFGKPLRVNEKGDKLINNEPPKMAADGWPEEDFGFTGEYLQRPENLSGHTLLLTFNGKAQVKQANWGPVSFTAADQAKTKDAGYADGYNAAANTSRYYLRCDSTKPDVGASFMLLKTQRTAAAPVGSGVTNVSLLMPGYEQDDEQNIFTAEFLENVKRFKAFRFMDWAETNSGEKSYRPWSQRVLPRPAGLCTECELCWEYMVQVSNLTGRDMWVNVNFEADDEYFHQLAKLLKNGSTINGVKYPGLRPDLNIYVEYSNEVWNYGFPVYGRVTERAWDAVEKGEKFGPQQVLLATGMDNPKKGDQALNYRWLAARMAGGIVPAFAEAFGAEAVGTRVRPVLAGWTIAADGTFGAALNFLPLAGWDPRQCIYAGAVAPYFGYRDLAEAHATGDQRRAALTVDSGLSAFEVPMDTKDAVADDTAATACYGVKLMAYETGPSTGHVPALGDGERDPRFRHITFNGLNTWYAMGGDLSNFFALGYGRYGGQYGDWTISDNPWDQNQPRNMALNDIFTQEGAPPLLTGPMLLAPQVIDGRQFSGNDDPSTAVEASRPKYRYSIRSFCEQTVDMQVETCDMPSDQTLSVSLNGQVLGELAPPAAPVPAAKQNAPILADLPSLKCKFRAGLNIITIQSQSKTGAARAVKINCLKFVAPGVDAKALAGLPYPKAFSNRITLAENTTWNGKLQFMDASTPSAKLHYELRSEAPSLIPNDAQHLSAVYEEKGDDVKASLTPEKGRVGQTSVVISVSNEQGVRRDWRLTVSVAPAAPTNLTATAHEDGAVELHWRNESSATFFDVERSQTPKDGKSWIVVTRAPLAGKQEVTYLDRPAGGKTWFYRVLGGRMIALPNGNLECVSGYATLKDAVTPPLVGGEGVRAANLLWGRTVFAKGLSKEFVADGGKSLNDGAETSNAMFAADGSGAVAFTGLPAQAIQAMVFWIPTIKDFQGKDVIETSGLPAVTVYASSEDYSAAGAAAALDQAHYKCVTDKPLPLSDGKGWWECKTPSRVYADGRMCWVTILTGLNVPAGTRSLLLTFAPTKSSPNLAEIQAFSAVSETPPANVKAESVYRQHNPVSFANPSGAVVDLAWAAVPGALTRYAVQRAADAKFSKGVQTLLVPPCATHLADDRLEQLRGLTDGDNAPLPPGKDYFYRVGARKADGTIAWGDGLAVHTAAADNTHPAPASLSAHADVGSVVQLDWPAVNGALGYKVERAVDADFSRNRVGMIFTTAPRYTDNTTETGATYFYRVRAAFADGDSDWATATLKTPELSPSPTDLRAAIDVGTVRLSWTPRHGKLQGYEIYRGTDPAHLEPLFPLHVGGPQCQFSRFTDLGIKSGKWFYAVRGVWFTADNPSEMKYTEFTPALEVAVP